MENATNNEILKVVTSLQERVAFLEHVVGSIAEQRGVSVPAAPAPQQQPAYSAPQQTVVTKPKTSTEIEVGQKWLSVVGIVLIFLAALFFVQFVFQYVGPAGKVLLSYAGAAILFGVSMFTQKKYPPFAGVVGAGAWGITYLVTYAMHFFPATRLITSTPLAMLLLVAVVGALIIVALYQKSKSLVSIGLVLGILTMVLSPLSLFSVVGTVLLLAVFAVIAVTMPWGDFILPATIGAYISYFCWFGNVLGRLPAQGGGLLEKQMIGLIALVTMWIIVAVTLLLRKDEDKAVGGQTDSLTLILASAGTALLGLFALKELVLVLTSARIARAIWLFLMAGLTGGWSVIAYEFRQKKDAITAGGIIAMILLMSSIAYFLPEQSSGTALAWAALGLIITVSGLFMKNVGLAAISSLPLIASAIRFIASDLQKNPTSLSTDFSFNILLGFVLAVVIIGSAALLRTLDLVTLKDKRAKRLPGVLLLAGLIVFFAMTAQEFSGAVPSVLWGVAGLATIVAGFFGQWKDARLVGLTALAVTVGRVFVHDLSGLEALPRVISFAILGGLLLLVGYGYNHNKEKLQKYLEEE